MQKNNKRKGSSGKQRNRGPARTPGRNAAQVRHRCPEGLLRLYLSRSELGTCGGFQLQRTSSAPAVATCQAVRWPKRAKSFTACRSLGADGSTAMARYSTCQTTRQANRCLWLRRAYIKLGSRASESRPEPTWRIIHKALLPVIKPTREREMPKERKTLRRRRR